VAADRRAGRGGVYLGNTFTGVVVQVGFEEARLGRRYVVKLDAPIDVSRSKLMSIPRQRLSALIDQSGVSVDGKGRPDGVMTLGVRG
jgi:hypothetical protein